MEKQNAKFEQLTIEQTQELLNTDINVGLTEAEAQKRLEENGPNALKEKPKDGFLKIFFSNLADPMIYVLFAAVAVLIGISIYNNSKGREGDWADVIIIVAVILINAIIGTVQEIKAQTSLEALKKLSSPESTVIRGGKKFKVKSESLVLGDVVILEEGDTIGADLRLVDSANLKANESSLTGESVPVSKTHCVTYTEPVAIGDRKNVVYMSTPVTYGRGTGIVCATGMDTEIGKIATALDNEEEGLTPLQVALEKLGKFLGILTLGIVIAVLAVQIVWLFIGGDYKDASLWLEKFIDSIALAVAAIPEGLAAVVTIVLSLGVQKMVKVNTIVRKLHSVETLGAVSVVCSDKTGTLTQNKMTVVEAYANNTYFVRDDFNQNNDNATLKLLAKGMSLCSNATVDNGVFGDPTEVALVVFANEFNMHKADLELLSPRVEELPFDSVRKMMSTKHTSDDKTIVYTKGALDSIMARTTKILDDGVERDITEEDVNRIFEVNKEYSSKALRVLALAYNTSETIDEENLVYVGMVAMIDPARPEAAPAVKEFKRAGIITVMITGDHKDTAFAIAKELGIAESIDQCVLGADVDKMTEEELKEICKTARVFARVSPENKVQIVKAFKANGNICAMTGDGVNDAPSLKAADIGIAMGITGTDVAKGAADMVLTDDNFASIEKAVEEGRSIYANIKKTVLFLLSSNIAEVLAMFLILCVGFKAPLIAIHLLWVNLLTDSLPAIALGMCKKEKDIMDEKPRDTKDGIFAQGGLKTTLLYGAVVTIAVLLAYFTPAVHEMITKNLSFSFSTINSLYSVTDNVPSHLLIEARTMAFTTLAFAELVHMLGMVNLKKSVFRVFGNMHLMMVIALIIGVALQLVVIEIPWMNEQFETSNLELYEWAFTALFSLLPLIVHEICVLFNFIKSKRTK